MVKNKNVLFLVVLYMICFSGLITCESPVRGGFKEVKDLRIEGIVIDNLTGKGLPDAIVRFYSQWDTEGDVAFTDEVGRYQLQAREVYCKALVDVPENFDDSFYFNVSDSYFICATKTGYDTLTYGAFAAGIHCFDIVQQVSFRLNHLNHLPGDELQGNQ